MGIFIIAEAGVNHNGSLAIAKKMVDAAKACGADAVKFQAFRADRLVSRTAPKAAYQKKACGADETQLEMLRRLELTPAGHQSLFRHCLARRILYLASPFDQASADDLAALGMKAFKVPSGEITNHPFLAHVALLGRPIYLSTGMSTLGEIEAALGVIRENGKPPVTLLHCVTEYPAPYQEINLKAMETMRRAFGLPVGYSDHTDGIEISIAAAALGAVVIEKHFTLDRGMAGPDHRSSLEPAALAAMIKAIRHVESALGDGIKGPAPCEIRNISAVRKSIVAARDIRAGEVLRPELLAVKRPAGGIGPERWRDIIGRKAVRSFQRDEMIEI
ncbi:MAG TPA: N-acetylneuraminate synthase [Deltaproteobacteria bacterium]|nr:N-acetylneuraminate synthase [Deltaproteobacteria bacterium]